MKIFDKNEISVTIHIPFCVKKRRGETALVLSSTRETRNAYLEALERELMSAGDILEGRQIASIHVGGGIATVVSPDRLARLLLKFKRTYNVAPRAELTLTAAPQTLVSPCLTGLNICNFNRISVIAYTPVDKLLETIGASHRMDDLEDGTAMLSKFGYPNIDFLLMYGIPGQTLTTIRNTILAATSLKGLKHVTLKMYELAEQSGVSFDECFAQYNQAVEVLTERTMVQYTADCFAREGHESPSVYYGLMGIENVGFGLGARTSLDDMVYQNTTDFESYLQNSGDFTKLITGVVELDEIDQMRRFIGQRLQLVEGFSEKVFTDTFGRAMDGTLSEVIQMLVSAGFVTHADGVVQPTPQGLMRTDLVQSMVINGSKEA